jgi:hypothetical protein
VVLKESKAAGIMYVFKYILKIDIYLSL